MNNQERKRIAQAYYSSISNNEILGVRMSPKYKGYVCLKVWNPTFKEEGSITIGIIPEEDELILMSEGSVYGASKISKFQCPE